MENEIHCIPDGKVESKTNINLIDPFPPLGTISRTFLQPMSWLVASQRAANRAVEMTGQKMPTIQQRRVSRSYALRPHNVLDERDC